MIMSMNEEHRSKLIQHRVALVEDMVPDDLVDYLYQENVISEHMKERIMVGRTRMERAQILLDLLPKRGDHAFRVFCEALRHAEQGWLADMIEA